MRNSRDESGSEAVNESVVDDVRADGQADEQPATPKRRRSRYAVADVVLRRAALGGFVLIAVVAAIITAVSGR